MISLFDSGNHKNVFFHDLSSGAMVQANQHLIVHGEEAIILDPGGHKVHSHLFAHIPSVVPMKALKHIFFSHQDPDIIAAANPWLMVTDATGYLSTVWMRFIPHFGVDEVVLKRIRPIPDEGMTLSLGGSPLKFLPAHFLHSPGNFQVYDPVSKILYSGDLGAGLDADYQAVADFDAHLPHMEGFHKRYMPSNKALRLWAQMVRGLDVEVIAPQHGAIFKGRPMVERFLAWAEGLICGVDLMENTYRVPA